MVEHPLHYFPTSEKNDQEIKSNNVVFIFLFCIMIISFALLVLTVQKIQNKNLLST
jgi:hypothetical protein